jgi:hypothetical protein
MYKAVFFLCLILLVWNLQAQEDLAVLQQNNEKRFNVDIAFNFGSEIKNGSTIAFGVLLYGKGTWNIRSHTGVNSYTLTLPVGETNIIGITEKITYTGSMSDIGIGRPYAYIDGGICFYGNQSKEKLFSTPLGYTYGLGGGIDINVVKKVAWYSEFGFVHHFMENNPFSTVFKTGFRYYI